MKSPSLKIKNLWVAVFMIVLVIKLGALPFVEAQENDKASGDVPVKVGAGLQIALNKIAVIKHQFGDEDISVQFILKNVTDTRMYFFIAPTSAATTNSGYRLKLVEYTNVAICPINYDITHTEYLKKCSREFSKDIENFTFLEPGDVLAGAIKYRGSRFVDQTNDISFSINAFVRSTPKDVDPLSMLDPNKTIPPSRIVGFQFPLIPISTKPAQ